MRGRAKSVERLLGAANRRSNVTPVKRDREPAQQWLEHFEGAGLDGVIAKPPASRTSGQAHDDQGEARALPPICVVAAFAGTRAARTPSARSSSASTTMRASCSTLVHLVLQSWRMRKQLVQELAPAAQGCDTQPSVRDLGGKRAGGVESACRAARAAGARARIV